MKVINRYKSIIYIGLLCMVFGLWPLTNYIFGQVFTSTKDLVNLGQINPDFIKAYTHIKIIDAWQAVENVSPQFQTAKIGVIDSGVDINHPEFQGVNFGNTPHNAKFDQGRIGHGTQVTGIIGANNISSDSSSNYISSQMNGIVSGVNNLGYVIEHRYDGGPNMFKVLANIFELSVMEQADVINLSTTFSFSNCNPILTNLAEGLLRPAFSFYSDVLFIIAAGETTPTVSDAECFLPGALGNNLDNVINVGGLDVTGENRWSNSPFGGAVNIAAPSIDIYAPRPPFLNEPEGQYDEFFGGTSASAPMVTGVAAILKALEPEYQKYTSGPQMTPAKIKEILQKSADPIITGELDKSLGSGCFDPNNNPQGFNGCRLNAYRAVAWLFPPTPVILEKPEVTPSL